MRKWTPALMLGLAILLLAGSTAVAQFKLTLNLSGMTPHVGQDFYLRALDARGAEVGRAVLPVPAADFSVDLYIIVPGSSYQIDFFADLNQNGQYDPPPTDHAWRLQLDNPQGDAALNFAHNTNFTDIGWPNARDLAQFGGDWTGFWHNLTFGSQGNITATVVIDLSAQTASLDVTTSGLFGFPDTVNFALQATAIADTDSLTLDLSAIGSADWTGKILLTHGSITGSITNTAFNATITFTGTFGPAQAIFAYQIPVFQANGVVLMNNTSIQTGVDERGGPGLPDQFVLQQNYPNPFNPRTTIAYHLPERSTVRLTVFDATGHEVGVVVDGVQAAGAHAAVFDATHLPSGVYFYRLRAGAFRQTRKLLLMK